MKRALLLFLILLAPAAFAAPTEPRELILQQRNWGLDGPGGIHAKGAWRITKGDGKIVVAVIDTGIDPEHPALRDSLWRKTNGDEYGFDYVTGRKNPPDAHGHGTHVAGIIRAIANVRIMPLRYFADGEDNAKILSNSVKAIHYAIDHGAQIINYSSEGTGFNMAEYKAIRRAEEKGILFVVAAGNQSQDNDTSASPSYPATYDLSNIIAVAATNQRQELIESSNWGRKHVHVAAPGERILSALPGKNYGYNTGTSQATAFVSGLAALLLAKNPELKAPELRSLIVSTVDPVAPLKDRLVSGGVINAQRALQKSWELFEARQRMPAQVQ